MNMQSAAVCYRAAYPFQGNSSGQLSVPQGALVWVTKEENGWACGTVVQPGGVTSSGWCPIAYLVRENLPTPPPANESIFIQQAPSPNTGSVWQNPQDFDEGFGGPIMGGSAAPAPAASGGFTSPPSSVESRRGLVNVGSGFQNAGAAIQGAGSALGTSFKSAGSTIKKTAVKMGSAATGAAVETKYRMEDMRRQKAQEPQQQHQPSGCIQKPQPTQNKDQWTKDVGNEAARGAVVHGAVGFVLSGGNLHRTSRAATGGAVYGGACGATRKWKPFG